MNELNDFFKEKAVENLLSTICLEEARERFSLSHTEVERYCLQAAMLPSRYQRNNSSISVEQQLQLFNSRVCVIGCGGLGGYIIEQLARLGVGEIKIIDDDVFEEHNLNRQLYASVQMLGHSKAKVAAERVREINPAITVTAVTERFHRGNGRQLLQDIDVAADAVDNLQTRLELAACCKQLRIPLVHGAIAGWYGQICTIYPDDNSLQKLYPHQDSENGVELELGNPAFTPAVIASLEVAEICKVLLNQPGQLRNRTLTIDLLDMEIEEFAL